MDRSREGNKGGQPSGCLILLVVSPWCPSASLFEDPRAQIVIESGSFFLSFALLNSFFCHPNSLLPLLSSRLKDIHGACICLCAPSCPYVSHVSCAYFIHSSSLCKVYILAHASSIAVCVCVCLSELFGWKIPPWPSSLSPQCSFFFTFLSVIPLFVSSVV